MSTASVLLCLVTGNEGYGVRQVWSDIFDGFQARGWKVVVAVLDARQAEAWRTAYPYVNVAPSPSLSTLAKVSPGRWNKIVSMIRRVRGQLAHAGWLIRLARESGASALMIQSPPESLLAGIVARRTGLRAVWLVPNAIGSDVPFDLNRRIYRLVFRLGKVVPISNSHYTDSTFGPGSFERHVVHLGVDTDHFRPGGDLASIREAFGIPEDALVIGLFARITPSKGQDRLIQALARSETPFHLLLCGGPLESAYGESLREHVETLGLGGRVHLAGQQTDLRPYYAACDVIANMRVDPEPFGLTIIEAMASGKPVLAHKIGGPSEIVLDNETGWLLPDVEIATIVIALDRIVKAKDDWKPMGEKARDHALRSFPKGRFSKQIAALTEPGKVAESR